MVGGGGNVGRSRRRVLTRLFDDWGSDGGGESAERDERHQGAVAEGEAEVAGDDGESVQGDHGGWVVGCNDVGGEILCGLSGCGGVVGWVCV